MVHGNVLEALPDNIGALTALERLWIGDDRGGGNNIADLPVSWTALRALNEFNCTSTFLTAPVPGLYSTKEEVREARLAWRRASNVHRLTAVRVGCQRA